MQGLAAVSKAQGGLESAHELYLQVFEAQCGQLPNDDQNDSDETATQQMARFLEALNDLAAIRLALGRLDDAAILLSGPRALPSARALGRSHKAAKAFAENVARCNTLRAAERAASRPAGLLGDLFAFSQPSGQGPKLSHRGEGPRKVLGRVGGNKV